MQRQRVPIVQASFLAPAAGTHTPRNGNAHEFSRTSSLPIRMPAQECKQLSAALRCSAADQQGQCHRVADFLCPTCDQLLWQPAVLTCGHAVCSACLPAREDPDSCCAACQLPFRTAPSTCRPVRHLYIELSSLVGHALCNQMVSPVVEHHSGPCSQLQAALQTLFPAEMEQRARQASGCAPCSEEVLTSQQDAARSSEGGSGATEEVLNSSTDASRTGMAHYGVG